MSVGSVQPNFVIQCKNYVKEKITELNSFFSRIFSPVFESARSLKTWLFTTSIKKDIAKGIQAIAAKVLPKPTEQTVTRWVQPSFMGNLEERSIVYYEGMTLEEFKNKNGLEGRLFFKDADCSQSKDLSNIEEILSHIKQELPLYCVKLS